MPETLEQHAKERLTFDGTATVADRVALCKLFLKEEMEDLRGRHDGGGTGLEIAHERAGMIDLMLGKLFEAADASYAALGKPRPSAVALVALGGYGRGELSPWSDIDVMFLYPTKTKANAIVAYQEHLTQEILYGSVGLRAKGRALNPDSRRRVRRGEEGYPDKDLPP